MYVRNSLKAKKFALYIAHFVKFVLKICINLGKNILICCKTLNKQTFSAKCLVDSKYLCTFASQFRNEAHGTATVKTLYVPVRI